MKRVALLLVGVATMAGVVAGVARSSPRADEQADPILTGKLPPGYRDWRLITMTHEEGNFHSFAAVLGNDVAIDAYRRDKVPFPDGTIVAALHYRHVPSEENDKIFGQPQSFVPGPQTNVQFMVKDSSRYASTGGWGFAQFNDGKPLTNQATLQGCFECHARNKDHDMVFAHYTP